MIQSGHMIYFFPLINSNYNLGSVILLLLYLSMTRTDHLFRHFIQYARAVTQQNNDPAVALHHSGSICVAGFNWCSYIRLKLGDNDPRLKIVKEIAIASSQA